MNLAQAELGTAASEIVHPTRYRSRYQTSQPTPRMRVRSVALVKSKGVRFTAKEVGASELIYPYALKPRVAIGF